MGSVGGKTLIEACKHWPQRPYPILPIGNQTGALLLSPGRDFIRLRAHAQYQTVHAERLAIPTTATPGHSKLLRLPEPRGARTRSFDDCVWAPGQSTTHDNRQLSTRNPPARYAPCCPRPRRSH